MLTTTVILYSLSARIHVSKNMSDSLAETNIALDAQKDSDMYFNDSIFQSFQVFMWIIAFHLISVCIITFLYLSNVLLCVYSSTGREFI